MLQLTLLVNLGTVFIPSQVCPASQLLLLDMGDEGVKRALKTQPRMTFAIIASAIISGSLVERMRFSAYAVLLTLWHHGLFHSCILHAG